MQTMLLDRDTWDLVVDSAGNIAVASDLYSVEQDVASACRLFKGELWLDTTQGLPYWEQVLGHNPPLSLIKQLIETQALTVPTVVTATCHITGVTKRSVSGYVEFTTSTGATGNVGF